MIDCISDNVTAYHKFSCTNQSFYPQFFNGGPAGCHHGQEARDTMAAFKKMRVA
jgi:hypothetical protein